MAKSFQQKRKEAFSIDDIYEAAKTGTSSLLKLDGRTPPHAIDVEKSVIGAILIDENAIHKVVDIVNEECFYQPNHKVIMDGILNLYDQKSAIDILTLAQYLKSKDSIEKAGGVAYLSELTNAVSTAANIEYHARIVLEKFILRKIITISANLAANAFEEAEDAFDILDKAEQELFRISSERLKRTALPLSEVLTKTIERLESIHGKHSGITGVASGFADLDGLTSGFQPSDLIIIAARPSMGKTAFALGIALHAATKSESGVLIFSLEMSARSLVERMLFTTARVDAHLARTGRLPDREWPKIGRAAGKLNESNIFIDDSPGLSIMELRAKARRIKDEKDIKLIVVDYLQLVHGPTSAQSREQEISAISRSLKALAKELDIPVLALSQLSRAVESRTPKRPMLSDLRESGAIEQDADVVMFIYRPEFYGEKETEDGDSSEGLAEIIVGKQRNGPVGTIKLQFIKNFAAFDNRMRYYMDQQAPVEEQADVTDIHPSEMDPSSEPPPF